MKKSLYLIGSISFQLDGHPVSHQKKDLSIFGVSGLPWHPLKPKEHFGMPVLCRIRIDKRPDFEIVTRASITREQTPDATLMGLRFIWDPAQRKVLNEVIKAEGHLPVQNRRKFPRIPFRDDLHPFPARALLFSKPNSLHPDGKSILCQVLNLSPEGSLVGSDDESGGLIKPGSPCVLILEPRGSGLPRLKLQVTVRRIFEDLREEDGKAVRSFGLQFSPQDKAAITNYNGMLRDILLKLQAET